MLLEGVFTCMFKNIANISAQDEPGFKCFWFCSNAVPDSEAKKCK